MQTSQRGIEFNRRFEGTVLRAYRDPVGIWTIGDGLTAASGVITPGPGMVITAEEAEHLLRRALARKYEPAVTQAMPGAQQHEFDGGISFHWNTGAIRRASWVAAWASRNMAAMRANLIRWNKGGGAVLPGLTRRREAEAHLIEFGDYGATAPVQTPPGLARVTLDLIPAEIAAARAALTERGYVVGDDARGVPETTVIKFQRDHDLTPDGILGRATLSTLQRSIDARGSVAVPATVAVGGGVETGTDVLPADLPVSWVGPLALIGGVVVLAWLAWTYRDIVAAKISHLAPRAAAYLRSLK